MAENGDLKRITKSIEAIAEAIDRPSAPWPTPTGGKVSCLTEAMIFIGQSIHEGAIHHGELADAVRDAGAEIAGALRDLAGSILARSASVANDENSGR